ncbi:nitroreductase family protein [Candidatus Woesearchaeota archaeon]|nr:nitroreductase family protein [Candidatus Woesearchaeota archaeon]
MDAIECIMTRRSVRKFMDVPVEKNKLGIILEAGAHAPSAGNIQNWKFFYVRRPDLKKAIADACQQQNWVATAPVIIVVASEPEKAARYYGVRGERLYSIQNCAAVAENMLLATHALGLASCWIGAFSEESVNRTLNMGEKFRPQIILPIGYPDEQTPEPMRLRIEQLVIFEDQRGGGNGGGGRIEDIPWALKDYNVLGRLIDSASESSKKLSKTGKKFIEKIKTKIEEGKKQ